VIVLVQVGEDVYHRQAGGIERCVIARAVAISAGLEIEPGVPIERIEKGREFGGRLGAEHDESIISQPPDHVHVDHGECLGQRIHRVANIETRSEEAELLTAKGNEDDRSGGGIAPQAAGYV